MIWLGIECLVLFGCLPLGSLAAPEKWLKFLLIGAGLVYALWIVTKSRRDFFTGRTARSDDPYWLLRVAAVCLSIFLFARLFAPEYFLQFPLTRPQLWIAVVLLYPWLSALPQEFLYRHFFFRRYARLFRNPWTMAAVSAAAFAWLHLMYESILVMTMTFLGGWLFALNYSRSRSLLRVWVEHALYGIAIFSSGLGRYFYLSWG